MERTLEWVDIPTNPTPEEFLAVFLDVDFVASGTRMQEASIFFVVAALIAIVMRRARGVVRRQLEAERGVAAISQLFGRFVPKAVADSMIEHEGALDPVEREATVLMADVASFTALTETKGAQAIVDTFNAYFEAASEVIGKHNGVVTQFIGDAVFATFNVPAADPEHKQHGIDAAVDPGEAGGSNQLCRREDKGPGGGQHWSCNCWKCGRRRTGDVYGLRRGGQSCLAP